MEISLTTIPTEILAQITSHLTALEVVGTLRGVGNSLLTGRLKRGGVTHLTFGILREQSQARIDFIRSLQLESFVVLHGTQCDLYCAKILLHGLSRNLKRFEIPHIFGENGEIVRHTDLDLFSPNFPDDIIFRVSKYLPWNVSTSYPRLEAFHIPLHPISDLEDAIFGSRFLAGLPSSLTSLTLPMPCFWPPAEMERLLPPHLTLLNLSVATNMPIFGQNLLDSLVSLNLTSQAGIPNEFEVFPPNLTELTISGRYLARQRIECPSLTSLTLEVSRHENSLSWHPVELLSMVPDSLTSLTVTRFHVSGQSESDFTCREKSHLKRLKLGKLACSTSALLGMMKVIPNVEDLDLSFESEGTEPRLNLEHFKALHGRALTTLSAELDSICFKSNGDDDISPLSGLVPCLKDLRLMNETMTSIDFGMIPPSVTRLYVQGDIDVATLHRLPPSVISFRAPYMVSNDSKLAPVFIPPTPPSTLSCSDSNASTSDISIPFDMALASSAGSHKYRCEWRPMACPSSPTSDPNTSIFLENEAEAAISTPESHATRSDGLKLRLLLVPADTSDQPHDVGISTWDPLRQRHAAAVRALPPLPESVTHLTLNAPLSSPLPHLMTLITSGVNLCDIDLSLYPSLTSLTVRVLGETMKTSPCPPNLTFLRSGSELSFPVTFLPLPASLTIIEHDLTISLGSLSVLKALPNLSRLSGPKPADASLMDWLNVLPPSMTRIKLRGVDFKGIQDDDDALKQVLDILAQRFTSLAVLSLSSPLSAKVYRMMLIGLPQVDVQGGPDNAPVREPALLATRLGYTEGTLTFSHGPQNVLDWCIQALPHYLQHEVVQTNSLNLSNWNDLAPLVSPNTTMAVGLHLDSQEEADSVIWPLALLDLDLGLHWDVAKLSSIHLPDTTLTSLRCTRGNYLIDILPSSLTSLRLNKGGARRCRISSVLVWPSNLRHLSCHIDKEVLTDNLKALPPSLEYLSLTDCLSLEQVELFPPHLKYFEKLFYPLEDVENGFILWMDFLQRRKILWLAPPTDREELEDIFGEVGLKALDDIVRQ